MTTFLECEKAEIEAVRGVLTEADFNHWFDKSLIKSRFKKACMVVQDLRCCYCQQFVPTTHSAQWDLEHVLCERYYPQFFADCDNLAVACKRCNGAKLDEDVLVPQPRPDPGIDELPTDPARYSIPHPRFDQWSNHLRHVNYQIYVRKSDKGEALITICKLNKPAIDDAGLSYESVVTAIKANFFGAFKGVIEPPPMTDEQVIAVAANINAASENERRNMLLAGLAPAITRLENGAAKRTPEVAVAQAQALIAARAAKAVQEQAAGPVP